MANPSRSPVDSIRISAQIHPFPFISTPRTLVQVITPPHPYHAMASELFSRLCLPVFFNPFHEQQQKYSLKCKLDHISPLKISESLRRWSENESAPPVPLRSLLSTLCPQRCTFRSSYMCYSLLPQGLCTCWPHIFHSSSFKSQQKKKCCLLFKASLSLLFWLIPCFLHTL